MADDLCGQAHLFGMTSVSSMRAVSGMVHEQSNKSSFLCRFAYLCRGDFGSEVAIGPQWAAQERSQTLDIAGFRDHALSEEALAHQAHVESHPARHDLSEVLLESGGVVARIGDGAIKHLRPDRGDIRAG